MRHFFRRFKNLWKLSGISVNELSPKQNVVEQLAEVFKNETAPVQPKRMAKIINMHPNLEEDDTTAE